MKKNSTPKKSIKKATPTRSKPVTRSPKQTKSQGPRRDAYTRWLNREKANIPNPYSNLEPTTLPTQRYLSQREEELAHKRFAFTGAEVSNYTNDWSGLILSPDRETDFDLPILRSRSRDLRRNSAYVKRFVDLLQIYVNGPDGLVLEVNADPTPKGSSKPLNDALELAWKDWGSNCVVGSPTCWTDFEHLCTATVAIDGECFIQYRIGKKNGALNKYNFALRLIDADYLDVWFNKLQDRETGNYIRQGVEYDEWHTPIAYHFWKRHPNDYIGYSAIGNQRIRVLATEVIHLYKPDRANQTRGIPWTAAALYNLHMLTEGMKAELIASRVAASNMFFIMPDATDASEYLDQYSEDVQNHIPHETMEMQPGAGRRLNPGEKVETTKFDHPPTAFEAFVRVNLRGAASSFNMTYAALASDGGQESFSSGRLGTQLERDHWKTLQAWMERNLHQKVWEKFVEVASLTAGTSEFPQLKGVPILTVQKKVNWNYRGFSYVDPLKDAQATQLNIAMGLDSRTHVAAGVGMKIEDIFKDLQKESDLAKAYNIDVFGASAPKLTGEPAPGQGESAAGEDLPLTGQPKPPTV